MIRGALLSLINEHMDGCVEEGGGERDEKTSRVPRVQEARARVAARRACICYLIDATCWWCCYYLDRQYLAVDDLTIATIAMLHR